MDTFRMAVRVMSKECCGKCAAAPTSLFRGGCSDSHYGYFWMGFTSTVSPSDGQVKAFIRISLQGCGCQPSKFSFLVFSTGGACSCLVLIMSMDRGYIILYIVLVGH